MLEAELKALEEAKAAMAEAVKAYVDGLDAAGVNLQEPYEDEFYDEETDKFDSDAYDKAYEEWEDKVTVVDPYYLARGILKHAPNGDWALSKLTCTF